MLVGFLFGEINLPNRPIQIGYVNKGGQGERIYSPYGHAITLSAYGGGAGAKTGLYYVNGKIRSKYEEIYSIPHLLTKTGNFTEKQIVYTMIAMQFFFSALIWII